MLLWQITIMPSLLVITLNGPICTLRKLHLCSWGLLNSIYLTAGKVGRPVVNWLGNSLKLLNISFHISFVCNVVRYPGYLPHLRSNATINIMVGNHLISLELGASTNSCWCFTFVAWPRLPSISWMMSVYRCVTIIAEVLFHKDLHSSLDGEDFVNNRPKMPDYISLWIL